MQRNAMHAMADIRVRVRQFVLRLQPLVDRLPRQPAVLRAERACRRDSDVDTLGILRIEEDGMHSHAARARLPEMSLRTAQASQFLPRLSAVGGIEDRRVLDAR